MKVLSKKEQAELQGGFGFNKNVNISYEPIDLSVDIEIDINQDITLNLPSTGGFSDTTTTVIETWSTFTVNVILSEIKVS
ncbi:MAG: hypothetical protein AAFX87_08240, partial [Bacteroidota bacterium]